MKKKPSLDSLAELDRQAHSTSDIRPLSPAMRSQWEAAKRTGAKMRPGRPKKDPAKKSLIVPISIDPALLKATDKFAKSAGMTRSRLVAEGLRLRIKA
jgi:hypothetical protein